MCGGSRGGGGGGGGGFCSAIADNGSSFYFVCGIRAKHSLLYEKFPNVDKWLRRRRRHRRVERERERVFNRCGVVSVVAWNMIHLPACT